VAGSTLIVRGGSDACQSALHGHFIDRAVRIPRTLPPLQDRAGLAIVHGRDAKLFDELRHRHSMEPPATFEAVTQAHQVHATGDV
jgi:hypothetical protein